MAVVNSTEALLAERQKTHGEYAEHARCTQEILRVLQAERGYSTLSDMQKETLHMIAHKMGRVVTGNPDIADHWDDIAGYAKLISQRLETPVEPVDIKSDPYTALALAWNCTRDEAKLTAMKIGFGLTKDEQKVADMEKALRVVDHDTDAGSVGISEQRLSELRNSRAQAVRAQVDEAKKAASTVVTSKNVEGH